MGNYCGSMVGSGVDGCEEKREVECPGEVQVAGVDAEGGPVWEACTFAGEVVVGWGDDGTLGYWVCPVCGWEGEVERDRD